ncbi:hypothetical protein GQ54DRAFT_258949 [Martensiomyces pterosporus]|nr:hypothetical protein GQ54DRAFT_258949 [Martensiomyces pterosporus]
MNASNANHGQLFGGRAEGLLDSESSGSAGPHNHHAAGTDDTYPLTSAGAGRGHGSAAAPLSGLSLDTPDISYETEKPHPYPLKFGPWWRFCSAADRSQPKTRILPCVAAILMPVTVLFVLTAVEGNWIQSARGYNGHRVQKATGYVVGNAIAVALAFGSALTIAFRQIDYFRRFASLRTAMLSQVVINALLGFVCILVGGLYQRNRVNYKHVWITPEYPCIFIGGFFAFLQMALLLIDYVTTPSFNERGHGYGSSPMQTAIGLSNIVNIWTGFGSLVFSNVEANSVWHPYNSCYNSWVALITTGSTVLNYKTTNSKIFILFWLPIGLLIMFIYFVCFGLGFIQRFDEKPLRRINEAEDRLRGACRELRRSGAANKELVASLQSRIASLQDSIGYLKDQRLRYFAILFSVGVLLKICSWLLGSIIFARTEIGWSYWDSMFFLFLNLLTVGIQDMVPRSASGMPLYHAYTYVDILCTAALDALLFHILYNLAPWPRYTSAASAFLGGAAGKVFHRRRVVGAEDLEAEQPAGVAPGGGPDYSYSTQRATDQLEGVLSAASRLRGILIQNAASQADLAEYERLLEAAENRLDDLNMSDKKTS